MKIAISGPANTGKTTLITKFIKEWPMYATPALTRQDILPESERELTEENQDKILDFQIDQYNEYIDNEYIIFDGCLLDTLAHTLKGSEQNTISDEYMTTMVYNVREALSYFDCIFVLPFKDDTQSDDESLIAAKRMNELYMNLMNQYHTSFDSNIFFPLDCPGIIMLESDNQIAEIKMILNKNGDLYNQKDEQVLQQQAFNACFPSQDEQKEMMMNLIGANEQLTVEGQIKKGLLNL